MVMSFSTDVKNEIGRHTNHSRHCKIAELLALVLATGEVELAEGQTKLIMRPETAVVSEKICQLIRELFDNGIETIQHSKYIEVVGVDKTDQLLQTIKLDEEELLQIEENDITYVSSRGVALQNCQFPRQVIQKDCCKKAFVRGIFLAAGSVNDPQKAYHFEIVVHNREMAEAVQQVINSFSLEAKVVKRKKYYVVYLKEGSMIVDILNVMEAHISLMDMENVRILKDINRRVNCETANIKKTVNAARRQIEDIEYIERTKGLKYLNDSLRQLAEIRVTEPDANLAELGAMLDPPVSKSGVNHRLRKISSIANKLREENCF